jgi:UDP-N-acetylmuramate: L-alanyl-gamma-D-glutamyl-meso-diaminopimelate ligase
MASLAGMLQSRGHKVTGSDQNVYPPMSTQLEALGIDPERYKAENIDIGATLRSRGKHPSGNGEPGKVLNRKLVYRLAGRDRAGRVYRGLPAGRRRTHGKTTTTSIAAWVCEVGGLDPSFLVGGIVQNFGASAQESEYFVIEGDTTRRISTKS